MERDSALADLGRPEHLGEFFAEYAASLAPARVLDPFAVSPVVAAAVSEVVPGAAVTAISHVERTREAGEAVAPSVEWLVGAPPALVSAVGGRFDLVVSSPPIGLRAPFEGEGVPDVIWRRDSAYLMLCLAAEKLAPGGKLAFLLGQASLFARSGTEMSRYLSSRGIELEASISFREGLAPLSHVETHVAIYSREARSRLFVARVFPKGPRRAIVDNLAAWREGPERELGFFADRDGYRGWERARAEQELETLLGSSSSVATIGSLTRSIECLRVKRGEPDPGFENVVYLPEVGTGPARLQIDWTGKGETRGVVALVLDPRRAEAGYVAGWLNGPSGKVARGLIVIGTTRPRTSLEDLEALRIPLPPIELQERSVRLQRRIAGARAELELLGERVAADATRQSLTAAEDDLARLLDGDDLDAWARRLPFPVASVLARYLAAADAEDRFERLLFFFEAFAALLAILGLSGVRANEQTWQRAKGVLKGSGRGVRLLPGATFGSWVWIGTTLARHLRDEYGEDVHLADSAGAEIRTAAVGVEDLAFYEALVDEELWSLLERARDTRNRHKGHGGVTSEKQLKAQVLELEQLLGALHERASRAFDRVALIQPGVAGYDGSAYSFPRARRLVGPGGTLAEHRMTTVVPLKEDALFLVDQKERPESPVETIPLVSLVPSPDTGESVCYFYSGLDGDRDLRFISYHLPRTETVSLEGSGIRELIDEIR